MKNRPQLLNVTPTALDKVKDMIAARSRSTAGIRIGIRTKGCSEIGRAHV